MKRIDNLRGGRISRAALILVPTLFAILGPMGVVASPFLSYGKTKLEVGVLSSDSATLRTTLAENPELLDGDARAKVRERICELDACVPRGNSPVLLHSLVRLLAEKAGVELESLTLSDATDAGFETLDDAITERAVRLRGNGPMSALLALPKTLASLGFPNTVTSLELVRADSSEPTFDLALTLSLFERADPPEGSGADEESSDGGN